MPLTFIQRQMLRRILIAAIDRHDAPIWTPRYFDKILNEEPQRVAANTLYKLGGLASRW